MNLPSRIRAAAVSGPELGQSWPQALLEQLDRHPQVARVVLARLQGSAPRDAGTAMLVTADSVAGSIGGGALEWDAIAAARVLLADPRHDGRLVRHRLGLELAQCCGGVVDLWIERWTRADRPLLAAAAVAVATSQPMQLDSRLDAAGQVQRQLCPADRDSGLQLQAADHDRSARLVEPLAAIRAPLWLFGAGHVGQALVPMLAGLPFRLTWIDTRPDIFPGEIAADISIRVPANPARGVADAPPGCRYLLMTHDHQIDYALCQAIVGRGDAAFIGMIGSRSKAARFRSRLRREGLDADAVTCPVGIGGIHSKLPAAIAVSVAAQLLQGLSIAPRESTRADDGCGIDRADGCAACGTGRRA